MDDWCLYNNLYVLLLTEANPVPDFLTFIKQVGQIGKSLSYAEFEDYYEGLSIEIIDDEEYINNFRAVWSIWVFIIFISEACLLFLKLQVQSKA